MTSTLNVYSTPPQMEHRGKQEAVGKAHVPTEPRAYMRGSKSYTKRVPSARGYVFAEGKPAEAKYLRKLPVTGPLPTPQEVRRLYIRTSKTQRKHAFMPGDQVVSASGYPGTVRRVHGSGRYDVEVVIAHKPCIVKMRESDISHHTHPHK